MACCCDFTDTVDPQFTSTKAGQELHRYRRKGAGPTTRLLIDGISRTGVGDGSLLDIGAGVGALTFELLERGFDRAVIVEPLPATRPQHRVRLSAEVDAEFLRETRNRPKRLWAHSPPTTKKPGMLMTRVVRSLRSSRAPAAIT